MAIDDWFDRISRDWAYDYPWLVRLLKNIPADQKKGKANERTSVVVFRTSDVQPPKIHSYLPVEPVADDLKDALKHDDVCFIYMEHRPFWVNLNISVVQALHEAVDLDPAFLHHHLGKLDKGDPDDFFTLLPSNNNFLQLTFGKLGGHASAMAWTWRRNGRPIVLLLGCLHPGQSLVTVNTNSTRNACFAGMEPTRFVRLQSQHPSDDKGLLNLASFLIREAQESFEHLTRMAKSIAKINQLSDKVTMAQTKLMLATINRFQEVKEARQDAQDHLQRFCKYCEDQGMHCSLFAPIMSDFQRVLDICDRTATHWNASAQTMWTVMGIEQARKGITSAESVRRLTIVALIFIPLNFSTSFFGMNLKQLGTSSISAYWFVILAFVTSLVCYTILEVLTLWDSQWIQQTVAYKAVVALPNKVAATWKHLMIRKRHQGGSLNSS